MPLDHTDEFIIEDDYLIIRRYGSLSREDIKLEREQGKPMFSLHSINKALFDYTEADLSKIPLIHIDDLAIEFSQDLPLCKVIAIVHPSAIALSVFQHIKSVLSIRSIRAELFNDLESAKRWLSQNQLAQTTQSIRKS